MPPKLIVILLSNTISAQVTFISLRSGYSRFIISLQNTISSPFSTRLSIDSSSHFQSAIFSNRSFVSLPAMVGTSHAWIPKLWSQCQWLIATKSGCGRSCVNSLPFSSSTLAAELPASNKRVYLSPTISPIFGLSVKCSGGCI